MTNEDWAERRRKDMQEDYEGRGFMSLVFGCPFFLAIAVFALSRPFLFAFGYSLLISALIMAGT